ncbi:retrovirus-related Pol polyprotein from transposon 17.6 [Trichonephila clavipes]|nr:retrovirus-related Pol polyprotein from transposon 17.6 [Trichonephila clavipes]
MRKSIYEYVLKSDICQKHNYKNTLPAGRLIPIVTNYPNESFIRIFTPLPRDPKDKDIFVITHDFTKWIEVISLRKASAEIIANTLFENYISRYGAPVKIINDNGRQFVSKVFEHFSKGLGINHVKTVVHRPQSNRTERVKRDLLQMIASFVNDKQET